MQGRGGALGAYPSRTLAKGLDDEPLPTCCFVSGDGHVGVPWCLGGGERCEGLSGRRPLPLRLRRWLENAGPAERRRSKTETKSANGFFVAGIEGIVAAHYRKVISEKTRDALARLRANGRKVSRFAPYGFKATAGGRLVPAPREQAIAQQIARLRASGLSLRGVSRVLAARGVMARNGRPFAAMTLSARHQENG